MDFDYWSPYPLLDACPLGHKLISDYYHRVILKYKCNLCVECDNLQDGSLEESHGDHTRAFLCRSVEVFI
jgi:hypothetical protein